VQQNCPEDERNLFWLDVEAAVYLPPKDAIKVLTMDVNASIGTRQPHEESSVCGFFGLQRVNLTGERMKNWLTHNGLCAVSTHFSPPTRGHHFGTWKHPRSKGMHQNDHIFVSRAAVKTVKS
jgi:hypothetical protein